MKYCIIGHQGFLGSALAKQLGEFSPFPDKDTETIFYLGSVTHIPFEKNPDYHMNHVIQDFLELLPFCQKNNIRFVYASSALVYEPEKDIAFRKCKLILELLASCYPNTLGLRIFPVYGPGGDSAIYKWCKDMKKGIAPKVFGDGTQKRDFIYIDDVIECIIDMEKIKAVGLVDVGAGNATSFNEIVDKINKILGTNLQPEYVATPGGYSKGIFCQKPLPIKVPLAEGIKKICEAL